MKFIDKIKYNPKLRAIAADIKDSFFEYLKAMVIMFALNFVLSAAGLAVTGLGYWSVLIGLGIAIVDLLPVFGSGAVFVPWFVYCLCTEDYSRAVGLAVIYVVLILVKLILEPIICGKRIGLSFWETLAASLGGLLLLGTAGIIAGPMIAVAIKIVIKHSNNDVVA